MLAFVFSATIVTASAYIVFERLASSGPVATDTYTQQVTKQKNPPVATKIGLPVRLMIPELQVDAKILYMGLTSDGDMEVDADNFQDVGWYQHGARPGNEGTAVIAGHVNGARERGIFIALHTLEKGDVVTVLDDADQQSSFVVRETRSYDQNDRPKEVFESSSGAHLNLITCAGSWNAAEQRFPVRLVVFTDKIAQ